MAFELAMGDEIRQIFQKSRAPEKAEAVVGWLAGRCREEEIPFADYSWKSLVNHVCAMVDRSVTGETLDIDASLFDGVGADSLALAQETVAQIGGIADTEKYLLLVHFESARESANQ